MSKELKIWLNVNPHLDRSCAKQYSDDILQNLLSQFQPNRREFEVKREKNGKPYVNGGPHFSYTHSGQLYAYVLDAEPIGIDLECINPNRNIDGVAKRYYHEYEWQDLKQLPPSKRMSHFYQLWTMKEAWCKQQGGVLWYYLPQSVSDSGLHFYHIDLIKGMACCVATVEKINHIDVNVLK